MNPSSNAALFGERLARLWGLWGKSNERCCPEYRRGLIIKCDEYLNDNWRKRCVQFAQAWRQFFLLSCERIFHSSLVGQRDRELSCLAIV